MKDKTMATSDIYLDNAATTCIDDAVMQEMLPFFKENYGNASAKYYERGKIGRRAVAKARQQVAASIGATIPTDEDKISEIVFTSCATEANNWVIKNAPKITDKKHLIISSVEHHAVLETAEYMEESGYKLTILPVDSMGIVNPQDLKDAITTDTALVSIMMANNEVGAIQPIKELAAIAKEHGALFHSDAVQALGKLNIDVHDLDVDFLSLSAHKFHGPKGVGALYIRKGLKIEPLLHGGGQENHRRAGTLNVPGIVGMGKAAEIATANIEDASAKEKILTEKLWSGLSAAIPKIHRNGHPDNRLPNILNIRFDGAEGEAILMYLDMAGVQVASGSACSTDSLEPSHVLLAMGIAQEDAHGSIRFSLSKYTTEEDIDKLIEIMPPQVNNIRQMSVTWEE